MQAAIRAGANNVQYIIKNNYDIRSFKSHQDVYRTQL